MQEYLTKQTEGVSQMGASKEEAAMLQMLVNKYEQMIDILKQKSELAMGRMALDIPLNLEDLKSAPDNIKLLEGDYVYIPHKPDYVLVLGDVYNQMSLPYDSGKNVD